MVSYGYWSLRPWGGMDEDFDVRGFVSDVEAGRVSFGDSRVWYDELKYRVDHGDYDYSFRNRLRYFFLNLFGGLEKNDLYIMVAFMRSGGLGGDGASIYTALEIESWLNVRKEGQ